jgi:hypothetical protein
LNIVNQLRYSRTLPTGERAFYLKEGLKPLFNAPYPDDLIFGIRVYASLDTNIGGFPLQYLPFSIRGGI